MMNNCCVDGCERPRWKTARTCHRHTPPSSDLVRAVWLLVTRFPRMGHERLADKLHCSVSMINRALGVLIDAGYIEVDPDRNGARRVIIGYGLTGVRHDRHRN